jgi:alpha-beta hydrolase superfamily lysophospholipase
LTPSQLAQLRRALPVFPTPAEELPGMADFCGFYRLDVAAAGLEVQHSVGTITSGPWRLATHLWQQPEARGNLVLLHGLFDHTGLYDKLLAYGLSRQYNVLMFDLPGHGLSTGEPAVIKDFAAYGRAIGSVLGQVKLPQLPCVAMAQSTGCAALVEFARIYPWPFQAAVLLAPLVRPAQWSKVRAGHMLLRHFTDSVSRTFNENSSDREFLAFIRRDPLQARRSSMRWVGALRRWLKTLPIANLGVGPVLVVQGDADGTVDWRYNINVIVGLFPGSRVEYVSGAGHQLANESLELRQNYFQRIDGYLEDQGLALSFRGSNPPT